MPSAIKENEGCCKHAIFTVNTELEQRSGRFNALRIRHLRPGCGILEGVVELCSARAQLCEQGRSALLWGCRSTATTNKASSVAVQGRVANKEQSRGKSCSQEDMDPTAVPQR